MVLISDPDKTWSRKISDFLKTSAHQSDICESGKDCQLYVYKNNPKSVILDIDTKAHSGLEVLKYLKLNFPLVKVILTFSSKQRFDEIEISKKDFLELGVSDILIKPYPMERLQESLFSNKQSEAWKEIVPSEKKTTDDGKEMTVNDQEFTRIKIESLLTGSTTIFDFYIRLSPNKYVKILHKGEFFNDDQIKKYTEGGKVEYLYFKTRDRATYINFINQLLSKTISQDKGNSEQKVKAAKVLVEKYIEEIYVEGLKPELIDEGMKICQNMYNLVQRDKGLSAVLKEFEEYDPPAYCHLFLTSLFSTIICKSLDWATNRTVDLISMGALFHDIGKLKFPVTLREKKIHEMTAEELVIYKNHPRYGAELLDKYPTISDPIKQVVFQHHEYVNGSGFPNGLSGTKIYPLAKIVSLANTFSGTIVDAKVPPLGGLKIFIPDKELTSRFDPTMMKALVAGFLRNK